MKEWLEYEAETGRIICLLRTEGEDAPEVQTGHAVTGAPEDWDGDAEGWKVQDGELVRTRMTPAERRELERQRRERAANARKRLKTLLWEFTVAQIEDDETRIAELKAEYRRLKALL